MKVVTWNVNSLKARGDFVSLYLDAESPDVLCIQELKLPDERVPRDIFESRGYSVAVFGQKTWNGVLIASKEPIEDVSKGLPDGDEGQSRLIAGTTYGIRFVNLYCPQGQAVDSPKFPYKLGFFAALDDWLAANIDAKGDAIVLGDINIAPKPHDVWSVEEMEGIPSYHPKEHEAWARLLNLGLHDAVEPHIEPGTFSFWDYRGGAFRFDRGMRIDHVLVTESLLPRVEGAAISRDWRKKKDGLSASDHAPVEVTLS